MTDYSQPGCVPAPGRIESFDERAVVFSFPADLENALDDGIEIRIDGTCLAKIAVQPFQSGRYIRRGEERLEFAFQFPPAMFNARHMRASISIVRVSDGRRLAGGDIFAKAVQRKPRILVLIPAGAPWKANSIQLYKQPWKTFINEYFNIGDMMVYDSTLKLLDYEDFDVADLRNVTEAAIERYNSDFDYCVLRGSNYINEGMDWENTRFLLERLHLPVYALGVGAQAAFARKLHLSEDSVAIWKIISERCGSIGVRGSFTADTLDSLGIKNVDIIGCPSLFRSRDRDMSLRVKDLRDVGHIAFSLRREVDASYSGNLEAYLETQRSAMLRLARECRRMTVTIHGEPEEKAS